MIKNWKLAIGFALALWVLIFVLVSALIIMPLPELVISIIGIFIAPIVAFVLAKLYFKKTPGDIKEGITLAVFWLVIGTILDLAVTIQYVKASGTYLDGLKNFYGVWTLWVSFLLTIAVVAAVAKMTRGGDLAKPVAKPLASQAGKPSRPPASPTPPPSAPPAEPQA